MKNVVSAIESQHFYEVLHANHLPQRVVKYEYDHNGLKLAHVGIFAETFTSGKVNMGWTISSQYGKARWASNQWTAYNTKSSNYSESSEHTFDSGFHVMLMNTKPELWVVTVVHERLPVQRAIEYRNELILDLKSQGYTTTTHMRGKPIPTDGSIGNLGWGKQMVKSKNCTQKKIYEICEKLSTGMKFEKLEDYLGVRRAVYKLLTDDHGSGQMSKGQIWSMLNAVSE